MPGVASVTPSPNIWNSPETYEVENLAVDPDRRIEAFIDSHGGWQDRTVLDIGCGSGFHLPRFADAAASVVGIEPHSGLAAMASRRTRKRDNVQVVRAVAQQLPLRAASVDVMHARWAYFFGPGCEPGLRELDRVMRRGGTAYVVDNDANRSTFGSWLRRGYPQRAGGEHEGFWSSLGWNRQPVDIEWRFASRAGLEAVVRIEFDAATAAWILAGHDAVSVDYAVNVWWRDY